MHQTVILMQAPKLLFTVPVFNPHQRTGGSFDFCGHPSCKQELCTLSTSPWSDRATIGF